jgi:uncharacterized protein (DUF488 family)
MTIFTIGFAKKSAAEFFELLKHCGAKRLLDIRLHNTSQMAGFTKRDDLRYFLKEIANMQYHEVPILAPEESMLIQYRQTRDWSKYENDYLELIKRRKVELYVNCSLFAEGVVLLCSESTADHCHRRLAAQYLVNTLFPDANIKHL